MKYKARGVKGLAIHSDTQYTGRLSDIIKGDDVIHMAYDLFTGG